VTEIKYQRSILWKRFAGTFLFVIIGVVFLVEGYRMREVPFLLMLPFFFLGIVCFLFTGPLWLFYLKSLFTSQNSIISFNDDVVRAWGKELEWSMIIRVTEKGPTIGKWGMLDHESWLFHLKDGSVWQVPTYQLLTAGEWKQARSVICQQVHERGWKSIARQEKAKKQRHLRQQKMK
jgi:hypothetical protein